MQDVKEYVKNEYLIFEFKYFNFIFVSSELKNWSRLRGFITSSLCEI